jgi:hypothetical protein
MCEGTKFNNSLQSKCLIQPLIEKGLFRNVPTRVILTGQRSLLSIRLTRWRSWWKWLWQAARTELKLPRRLHLPESEHGSRHFAKGLEDVCACFLLVPRKG